MPADVFVTLRIMPVDPSVDLVKLRTEAEAKVNAFGARSIQRVTEEPVAFGLKALVIIFVIEEAKSNLDPLEEDVRTLEGVQSAEVVDVRRTIG